MVKADGTLAKSLVMYYNKMTNTKATPSHMARSISSVKKLLEQGYSEKQIKASIKYIVEYTDVEMYSIGFLNSTIDKWLGECKSLKAKQEADKIRKHLSTQTNRTEMSDDVESRSRNARKAGKLGTQSRFGKKHNFDMFKE